MQSSAVRFLSSTVLVSLVAATNLRPLPTSFLQSQLTQRSKQRGTHEAVPTSFFEADRFNEDSAVLRRQELQQQQSAAIAAATAAAMPQTAPVAPQAPFDVGSGAVPLPRGFLDEETTQRQAAAPQRGKSLSLAEVRLGAQAHAQAPLRSRGFASGARRAPATPQDRAEAKERRHQELLVQQAAMEAAVQASQAVEDARKQEEARAKALTRDLFAAQQPGALQPQALPQLSAMQAAAPAALAQQQQPLSEAAASIASEAEAQNFFEAMGDVAGKVASPGDSRNAAAQPQEQALTQVVAGSASDLAVRDGGHSMAGVLDFVSSTGETGEATVSYGNPALAKMGFGAKTEPMLKQETRIIKKSDEVTAEQQATRDAFAKLKAETYHSANLSLYRLTEREKLATDVRQAGLLADANQYKANLERQARMRAEDDANYERVLHLSGAAADGERAARERVDEEYRAEEARIAAGQDGQRRAEAAGLDLLADEQRRGLDQQALANQNFSQALAGAGVDGQDLAMRHYQAWANSQAVAEQAQREKDAALHRWLAAADAAAAGARPPARAVAAQPGTPVIPAQSQPLSAAAVSELQPPTEYVTTEPGAVVGGLPSLSQEPGMQAAAGYSASAAASAPLASSAPFAVAEPSGASEIADFTGELSAISAAHGRSREGDVSLLASPRAASPAAVVGAAASAGLRGAGALPSAAAASGSAPSALCRGPGCPMVQDWASFGSSGAPVAKCTPQCTWRCETPVCDEVCEPECEAPQCEVRCSQPDLSQCHMACDKPQCSVMCPERLCATGGCPSCATQCQEPQCFLQCPAKQQCRDVCEQPKCRWNCKAPRDCPKPQCKMVCEQQSGCPGSTFAAMPPLQPGETAVKAFTAPSVLQTAAVRAPAANSLRGAASLAQTDVMHGFPAAARASSPQRQPSAKTVTVSVKTAEARSAMLAAEAPPRVRQHLLELPVAAPVAHLH
eukprot:TRINITY_DN21917_c0_g2_i1.p1 TRINITY_DN21917_c0_g2~~TRINITY_DN21917_c0_g2_i1.p1  ORF type:complete len:965 (+),score=261.52 TRINITY_DN21917_c0_g2_i1:172-3066(+)